MLSPFEPTLLAAGPRHCEVWTQHSWRSEAPAKGWRSRSTFSESHNQFVSEFLSGEPDPVRHHGHIQTATHENPSDPAGKTEKTS